MVFCNNSLASSALSQEYSHNPYFNRWFSAIIDENNLNKCITSHNPYFNRWFSAIHQVLDGSRYYEGHNPYFNRWFSAI